VFYWRKERSYCLRYQMVRCTILRHTEQFSYAADMLVKEWSCITVLLNATVHCFGNVKEFVASGFYSLPYKQTLGV
jgi:hypothetical protein